MLPPLPDPVLPELPSPWRRHRLHFENNRTRPLPDVPAVLAAGGPSLTGRGRSLDSGAVGAGDVASGIAGGAGVTGVEGPGPAQGAAPLARVLARFQLGETGEGRIAREIYQAGLVGIDGDYRRALELFVKEEGRHARILATLVHALGGRLLSKQASTRLFRWCRRLLGVRFKLLVLLVAEVVGGEMYAALAVGCRWPTARAALEQLAADERHHLSFHIAFLRGQAPTPLPRLAGRCALWIVGLAAVAVVLLENGGDLRALALDRRAVAGNMVTTLKQAAQAAFGRDEKARTGSALGRAGRPSGRGGRPREIADRPDGSADRVRGIAGRVRGSADEVRS